MAGDPATPASHVRRGERRMSPGPVRQSPSGTAGKPRGSSTNRIIGSDDAAAAVDC